MIEREREDDGNGAQGVPTTPPPNNTNSIRSSILLDSNDDDLCPPPQLQQAQAVPIILSPPAPLTTNLETTSISATNNPRSTRTSNHIICNPKEGELDEAAIDRAEFKCSSDTLIEDDQEEQEELATSPLVQDNNKKSSVSGIINALDNTTTSTTTTTISPINNNSNNDGDGEREKVDEEEQEGCESSADTCDTTNSTHLPTRKSSSDALEVVFEEEKEDKQVLPVPTQTSIPLSKSIPSTINSSFKNNDSTPPNPINQNPISLTSSLPSSLSSIIINESKSQQNKDDKVYKVLSNSSKQLSQVSIPLEQPSNAIEIDIDEEKQCDTYDRQQFYEFRESHRKPRDGDIEHHTMAMDPEGDMNKDYDQQRIEDELRRTNKWKYIVFLYNKNKHRWDIKDNPRFYKAAQIITRIGFTAKFFLYFTLGLISMVAAVDKKRDPLGPAAAFEELQEMFSGGAIFLLLCGLWSYGCWGIFYVIFDVDRLGHKTAGAILKRFGRIFSSGFYFVLGVNAVQVLARQHREKEGTEQILTLLYKHVVGKIIVCVLGVTFFIVSIVYLFYFFVPAKFKRELSTERMNRGLYYSALAFARIGAIGRSMFFGAFGGVLIKAVYDINQGEEGDTTLLGFQGVFRSIAKFNYTLLFIIASLIVVYAFWCLWLVFFRRLPAHADAKVARQVLGTKINPEFRFKGILFRIPKKKNEGSDISMKEQYYDDEDSNK